MFRLDVAREIPVLVRTLWIVFGGATVRQAALVVLAAGAVRLWPRASAAQRHLVWTVVCCSIVVLPVLRLVVPRWNLQILPAAAQGISPAMEISHQIGAPVLTTSGILARGMSIPSDSSSRPLWIFFAVGIWGSGALVVLVSLLRSQGRVQRFVSTTIPLTDARVQAIFAHAANDSRLVDRVSLRQHPSTVPMVCGILRPVIVLPTSVSSWTDARLRHVLLHEVAHIKRLDSLTQAIASLACLLYWYNPLVWGAARALRTERERACDDAVLAAGSRPSAYATDLLELTQFFRPMREASFAALTFAHSSQIHMRLRAVIDTTCHRTIVSRRRVVMTWGATLGIVYPIVSLTPQPRGWHHTIPQYRGTAVVIPHRLCLVISGEGNLQDQTLQMQEPCTMNTLPWLALAASTLAASTPAPRSAPQLGVPTVGLHVTSHGVAQAIRVQLGLAAGPDTSVLVAFVPDSVNKDVLKLMKEGKCIRITFMKNKVVYEAGSNNECINAENSKNPSGRIIKTSILSTGGNSIFDSNSNFTVPVEFSPLLLPASPK